MTQDHQKVQHERDLLKHLSVIAQQLTEMNKRMAKHEAAILNDMKKKKG